MWVLLSKPCGKQPREKLLIKDNYLLVNRLEVWSEGGLNSEIKVGEWQRRICHLRFHAKDYRIGGNDKIKVENKTKFVKSWDMEAHEIKIPTDNSFTCRTFNPSIKIKAASSQQMCVQKPEKSGKHLLGVIKGKNLKTRFITQILTFMISECCLTQFFTHTKQFLLYELLTSLLSGNLLEMEWHKNWQPAWFFSHRGDGFLLTTL